MDADIEVPPVIEQSFEHELLQIFFIVLIALVLQLIARRYIDRLVQKAVHAHHYTSHIVERQRVQTLVGVMRTVSAIVIWLVALIFILAALEVNIAALLTGAGLAGIVLAYAAQDTIKDVLAGMFILLENQYRIDDIVEISGKAGVVESISLRVTRLRDLDGNLHIIPNGHTDGVTNMTETFSNVNMNIGVSYSSDLDKVIRVVNETGVDIAKEPEWKEFITEPIAFLRVDSFDDSAVTVKALGKVAPGKQWEIAGEFRLRLKTAFEKKGIEIPFPQRTIHTVKEKS